MKVTTPPRTSVPMVEPRLVISKNRSKPFFGSAVAVSGAEWDRLRCRCGARASLCSCVGTSEQKR